jgi:hypothetical protein
MITDITFYNTNFPGDFSPSTYTIHLSTSNFPVNALDTSVLSNNVGADNALFGVFPLSGAVPAGSFTLSGGPFTYDPANGDLLIDIMTPSKPFGSVFLDAMNGDFGTDSSRAHNYDSGFTSFGLVTQFTFTAGATAVPEPASLTLLCIGALGIAGYAGIRRKKQAVAV